MTRSRAIRAFGAAVVRLSWVICLAVACRPELPDEARTRPNILFVSFDTLRADHTSLGDYTRETTPHIARVASEGTSFSVAYAPMATTGPSHASMFTGLYPIAHGVVWNGIRLSPDSMTLAEILTSHGYQTAALVSSFVLDETWGYSQGFADYFDDFERRESSAQVSEWNGMRLEGGFDRRGDRTADRAIAWLEGDWDRSRPFFLFVHFFDPHTPYSSPERAQFDVGPAPNDPLGRVVADYDAEIVFADRGLGRVMDEIRSLGLDEETLVVITADHGEGLMMHGHLEHGVHLYEEAIRVPLVFRWKGKVEPGQVLSEPVELVDLAPTILELAGIEAELALQGRSLAPVLAGTEDLDPDRPIFLHRRRYAPQMIGSIPVSGERWGIRRGDWKLIAGNSVEEPELYNLRIDPNERTNVIAYHPDRVDDLQSQIDAWKLLRGRDSGSEGGLSEEQRARLEVLGYVE